MKKVLLILMTTILYSTLLWSQQWIGFTKTVPTQPEITLNNSNNQQVNFTVKLSGFFSTLKTEAGVNYQRLSIPGYGVAGKTGEPEIPVISKRIAVPVCSQVNCLVQITASQTLTGYRVYPTPELQPDNAGKLQEVFALNPSAYLQNSFIPSESYTLSEIGTMRNQHFVAIEIYPILFNPVTGTLQIATEMEITLTFDNPTTDVNVNTGIFNNVATHTFLNYQDQGITASINDKAFLKAGFTPGNVQWFTITDPAQANTITADYLIICAEPFFTSQCSEVQRIAEHRAWYNGFDVAILNVADILSDDVGFYYEGQFQIPIDTAYKKEQRMRTCISRIYQGGNAHHTGDGHLGYVLLIGDVGLKEGDDGYPAQVTGVPTSYEYSHPGNPGVSDYYFSCVGLQAPGNPIGCLYIGRFCVAPNLTNGLEELHNMVEKTIYFESEYKVDGWRNTVHAANDWQIGSRYYTQNFYYPFLQSLLHDRELHYVDAHELLYPNEYGATVQSLFKGGSCHLFYYGHGYEDGWDSYDLKSNTLMDSLINVNKTPFCFIHSCLIGSFSQHKCFVQKLTSYSPNKGFVAAIAASNSPIDFFPVDSTHVVILDPPERPIERAPYFIYQHHAHIVGEIFSTTISGYMDPAYKKNFNIFGDPALNIMAEGYQITGDITAQCPTEVTTKVYVRNGASLTVPSHCALYFLPQGQLIIEEGGALIIEEGAQIYGQLSKIHPAIHVKGGEFIVSANTIFHNIDAILLENAKPNYFDDAKLYNLNDVTFNNTPLIHHGSHLNISNCTFYRSNVKTSVSISNINNCFFHESLYESSYADKLGKFATTTVSNCIFTGNFNCPDVPTTYAAIQLNNSYTLELHNNSINGYPIGIKLNSSGATTAYYYGCKTLSAIHDNEITNCMIGLELYNSIVNIVNNNIHDNTRGVLLYNNSSTSFYGWGEPTLQPQNIKDNTYYELYASSNSFPAIFRFNNVIDEDNGGNSFDDPMVYWDLDYIDSYPSWMVRDVKYNCWGNNFDPREDFYPFKYYAYDPIVCIGKSAIALAEDEELFKTGLDYLASEEYISAQAVFLEVIENYPESRFAIAAMHELFSLEKILGNDFYRLQSYFTSFTPEDSALFDVADFLATRSNVMEREWQQAIDWYEERIETPPSYQDSVFAVIDLGNIHLMMEEDTIGGSGAKSGARFHYRLENIKPKSREQFEENRATLLATLPQKPKTENPQTPHFFADKKGALNQNIPNPTNGTTTINYEVHTEGSVEIRIYNSIGQLMKSLPQGIVRLGTYQTKINVSGFPVGLYQYSLLINGEQADTKKMIVN